MKIQKSDLQLAVERQIISAETLEQLWPLLEECQRSRPSFQGTHILYYLGGMIAIGALSLFMTMGWELFGGWGVFAIALGMAMGAIGLTRWFLQRQGFAIPAGIMLTLAVVLVPLAIYGLQAGMGLWVEGVVYRDYHTHIDWRWVWMELGTLLAASLLLWRFRLPFAVMPVAVTLWYMSMDFASLFAGQSAWEGGLAQKISILFGLGMLGVAFWVDLRNRSPQDFAFWLYLFGVITFWGGLSLLDSADELGKFLYCCVNVGMIFLGGLLMRRVFAVFGGLGMSGYLFYLSHKVFVDSVLFPFVLTGLGLGLVYLGVLWQQHEARLAARYRPFLPTPLQEMLERRR
ncbi:MAG: DUF2157 domain-containing protein [Magnetococcales bacterium]|nr:DUF2157 domain-containing protein [Magnetococcales bacterium]